MSAAAGRLLRSPSGLVGSLLVGVVVAAALVSLVWTPYDPTEVVARRRWRPVSAEHWFGTDGLGRDVFSQVMAGARTTLLVAAAAVALAAVLGTSLAVLGSVPRRRFAEPVNHLVDVLVALPTLVLALVLAAALGGSNVVAVVAIGVGEAVVVARVARAELARALVQDYVLAAAAAGSSTLRTVRRHLLPNIAPVLLVQLSLALSLAVLAEAALSYLGLGAPPPTPSWGRLLGELQSGVRAHPWAVVAPGVVVVATTLGFNLLGDGLRDATDPALRRRIPGDPLGVGR